MNDMSFKQWRPGPETPRAHTFEWAYCDDPNCGVHIVAYDRDHKPICEIVCSPTQSTRLACSVIDTMYEKAVVRDIEKGLRDD